MASDVADAVAAARTPGERGDLPGGGGLSRGHGRVVAGVTVAGFCAFLNLYATQPLLPLFRQLFGASELQVSLTVAAPVLAVALAAPFVGLLADTVGRKRVIVAALLLLVVPTFLAATAGSLPGLVAWRFLQGLVVPGIIAVTMAYVAEESPADRAGWTMAAYVTGTVIGGFCGRFVTGLVVAHANWRAAFVVLGALTLAGALATWASLPRSTRFVRQPHAWASLRAMLGHLRNPALLATYAVGFDVLFSHVGVFTYVSFYLGGPPFGLGPAALGSIFFVYLFGAVVTPLGGRVIDWIGHRRTLLAALGVTSAGILLTLVPAVWMVIVGVAIFASGLFVCSASASGHVGHVARGAKSSAAGLYVALYYAGGTAGSVVPGLAWTRGGWGACVAVLLGVQVLTALIAWRTWPRARPS